MKKSLFLILLAALLLVSVPLCACAEEEGALYVKKVEDLPDDFILGMDVSSVIAEENSGVVYYDFADNRADVFEVLAASGVNTVRCRIWNHPFDGNGNGYGGGNCDIETAVQIGRRASAAGMGFIADFHYSDFWADPSKQMVPLAWKGMEIEEKIDAVYEYTRDCLIRLRDAGVRVTVVQLGNETNGALCGEKIWFNIQYLMQAGARATREIFPEALVALHFTNPEKVTNYADYAKKMAYYAVDYDIFATSYYPYWHGTLDNLAAVLNQVAETYGKKVMVMETSYAYTAEDSDFYGNTVSSVSGLTANYPFTVQGQANAFRDIVDTVAHKAVSGIGVVYWEGAWISVGGADYAENKEKWETYGSGWASSYAKTYDPKDAGKYYGGCAVDNQAMFDAAGHPLESLKVFSLVRTGSEAPLRADALEEALVSIDLNGDIALPETVNAIMNDNSRQAVPVVWDLSEELTARMKSGGPKTYTVTGDADGEQAVCTVKMIEFNFLVNDSFETGDLTGWELTELGHADELYVENKKSDSLSGSWHMHFWSAKQDTVEFRLEQTPETLKPGGYRFTLSIMGGDCGQTDIYMYIKVNGETVVTRPMKITSYNNWDTGSVTADLPEGGTLTVGVYVKAQGKGNGAWGKIDDAMLNSVASA